MSDKKTIVLNESNDDSYIELSPYFEQKYMEYSVSVLKSRAIPYLADGLKPVQRRVIYAMMILGNYYSEKHKKSARIVGDVIGKYHPHGDSSVYEAAVRMSQNWIMRYPFIDGQGNFGSRDGDNAAAMRYTESRLTQFAEDVFLADLGKGTVDFKANFDSSLTEPELFPSKLNTLLLNGASGIAVAMATEIPSHNMREINAATIALLENPDLDLDAIMEYITGPDFATGGQIVDSKETIKNMYESGRGTIRVRAKWKIEKLAKGNWQAVVYELPPQQSINKILEKIGALQNPVVKIDPKTKKPIPLTVKQQTEKAFVSNLFEKVSDGSDRNESMRIVFVPKSSKQDPEEFMHSLLNVLDLQETYSANMTTVGLDGRPICKNLLTILNEWNEFRFKTVTKRCLFELEKAEDRTHILNGRMIAFLNIDEVIKIIKEGDDPKSELIAKFSLSEIQAEDILEIKLRQLARLEAKKIEKEIEQLRKVIAKLNILLNNKKKMNQLIIEEIRELDTKYGDDRRTIIKEDSREISSTKVISVSKEPISIYFTDKGWITSRKGHNIENENIPTKQDDKIIYSLECMNNDEIGFLGSDGRGYSIKANEIPSGKTGYAHINTFITPPAGIKLKCMIVCDKNTKMLVYGAKGYGFITSTENFSTRMKAGKAFINLDDGEDLMEPILIKPEEKYVAIRTSDSRVLTYTIDQIKELDKGKGVMLAKLDNSSILELTLYEKSFYIKKKNKWIEVVNNGTNEYSVNRGSKGKVHNDILSIARSVQ